MESRIVKTFNNLIKNSAIESMFKDGNRKMFNFMKFIGVIIIAAAAAVALFLIS